MLLDQPNWCGKNEHLAHERIQNFYGRFNDVIALFGVIGIIIFTKC
jgi:hypothetical protein